MNMRSFALSVIGVVVDTYVPGLPPSLQEKFDGQNCNEDDGAASVINRSRPRGGGVFSYFNSRVRARPNRSSHSMIFDIDEDLSIHPLEPIESSPAEDSDPRAIGYDIDEDIAKVEDQSPPTLVKDSVISSRSIYNPETASQDQQMPVGPSPSDLVDRVRIEVRQVHELMSKEISMNSIESGSDNDLDHFMICNLESAEPPVVSINLFMGNNVMGSASISVPHTSMLAQRIIVRNVAFTVRLHLTFEQSTPPISFIPAASKETAKVASDKLGSLKKLAYGASHDITLYFREKFWSFFLLYIIILFSVYLGNGYPRSAVVSPPHTPIAFPRRTVLAVGERLRGGCTYLAPSKQSDGSAPRIAGVMPLKSFDDIIVEWFAKAASLQIMDSNKCVPTYFTLEESGELSVFQDDSFRPDAGPSFALPSENNSDESKALTLLWRSSKPAGLSEASLSQASIETEKPLPWWKRVVLSPFRFVARRVVRSLETPPAQQLISASCASDNKIAVALGSQVVYVLDIDQVSELHGVVECI